MKLIITISIIFSCLTNGHSQFQITQSSNTKQDYELVLETIRIIEESTGDASVRSLLEKTSSAFGLRLKINEVRGNTLAITFSKHKKIKVKNRITNIDEANRISLFIKPLIAKKLDSLNLNYDYEEFLSDFLLTISNENSWLIAKPIALSILKRGIETPTMSKDSLGNFFIKSFYKQFGLQPGDKILSIQGIPCKYLGGGMAERLLSATLDQDVKIIVKQNGQIIDKILTRTAGKIKPMIEDSLGLIGRTLYIRPYLFRKGFSNKFRAYIQSNDSIQSIILDLQNCEGGRMDEICDFTSVFLKVGDTICGPRYINLLSYHAKEFIATFPNPLNQKKIVVLINERTASGAEIIALSLKIYKKAQIIGEKSFGYCDIDIGYSNMKNGKFVCRTKIGEYCGPANLRISGNGIDPDIKLTPAENAIERALIELQKK
jgi:hypothetical protein